MGRYDDDADDEQPQRRAPKDDEDTSRKPSSSRDEDEDDDAAPTTRVIKRGWSGADSVKTSDSPFAQRLEISEDPVIVKFLEDEPYAAFRQHWIERPGQKSFTCLTDLNDKGCPLCDAGNRPSARFSFNVALLVKGDDPVIKSYDIGTRVIDQLKNFNVDPRQGPLVKHYWAISRSGKGARSSTNHQMIKERDLEEEYGLTPIDEVTLKKLKAKSYDTSIVKIPTYKELMEIAKEDLDD